MGFTGLVIDDHEGWDEEDRMQMDEMELANLPEMTGANRPAAVERLIPSIPPRYDKRLQFPILTEA
ncbi:efflux pump antibiotic resistance protein [Penicillium cinerascens]|uniref:Efflux pump antibiotic resistance protein n=1 Tax=Penicillium cinerascens TaxID=70096 RepID=A0A9W9NFP2_9EURO|nr:efflux pump antibiotic resistance protein [Penicillium cinerascens]KAJ5218966.1 efflux pump antibiotic resistance protein [Penicillium cinerascens]